jgi:hypothetical protein
MDRMRPHRILLDADGAEGNGNSPTPPDFEALFSKAVAKAGDSTSLARTLYADSERLRAENAELKAKLPPVDARVLSAAEAAAFDAFGALGLPDEVSRALEDARAAVAWRAERERLDLYADACEAVPGKWNPKVLAKLPGADSLALEVVEVKAGGKAGRSAVVRAADGTATPLEKYAEANWPEFLPSLRLAAAAPAPTTGPRRGAAATPPPTPGADPLSAEERRLVASGRYSRIR